MHSFKNIVKYYKVIKMEKEIILENLDESIVNEATFYSQQNIPSQISQALYLYGSTTDYQVLGFIDASGDGSKGMIFTDQVRLTCSIRFSRLIYGFFCISCHPLDVLMMVAG